MHQLAGTMQQLAGTMHQLPGPLAQHSVPNCFVCIQAV